MQPSEQIVYFNDNTLFILKLRGALRFTCTPYLDAAVKTINKNETEEIILDMTEAKYIDSTIMGSIAKLFLQDTAQAKEDAKKITIVYQHDDIKLMFSKIGFDRFFNFVKEEPRIKLAKDAWIGFTKKEEDVEQLKDFILNAHQTLNKLQPKDSSYDDVVKSFKDK